MATAIITGYTPHAALMRKCFEPLLALRQSGQLKRILYVTWDKPEIDAFVTPALTWPGVEIVRLPQPVAMAKPYQSSFVFQSRNLAAALQLVTDPNELIVKLRPDFLFDTDFLAGKIASFDRWRSAPDFSPYIPVVMPPSPFAARVWVPWATANMPFYMEDAAFMGLACDLQMLADPRAESLVMGRGDEATLFIVHALRFVAPFLDEYPLFVPVLDKFHLWRMDPDYRKTFLLTAIADPFFWHLVIAQAWILATSFHIDCGAQGQLRLVQSTTAQQNADCPVAEIPDNVLYADVEGWRQIAEPGTVAPLLLHLCGRLVDDHWQHALFSGPVEQGFTHDNLVVILRNLEYYGAGVLDHSERAFYDRVEGLYRDHFQPLT